MGFRNAEVPYSSLPPPGSWTSTYTSSTCVLISLFFFFNDTATTEIYTLSLHDALPIFAGGSYLACGKRRPGGAGYRTVRVGKSRLTPRSRDRDLDDNPLIAYGDARLSSAKGGPVERRLRAAAIGRPGESAVRRPEYRASVADDPAGLDVRESQAGQIDRLREGPVLPFFSAVHGLEEDPAVTGDPSDRGIGKRDVEQGAGRAALADLPRTSAVFGRQNGPQGSDRPAVLLVEKQDGVQVDFAAGGLVLPRGPAVVRRENGPVRAGDPATFVIEKRDVIEADDGSTLLHRPLGAAVRRLENRAVRPHGPSDFRRGKRHIVQGFLAATLLRLPGGAPVRRREDCASAADHPAGSEGGEGDPIERDGRPALEHLHRVARQRGGPHERWREGAEQENQRHAQKAERASPSHHCSDPRLGMFFR